MIVCVCYRVSDRDSECKVREGCRSFELLQCETGVATGCGACAEYARNAFECRRIEGPRAGERRVAAPQPTAA